MLACTVSSGRVTTRILKIFSAQVQLAKALKSSIRAAQPTKTAIRSQGSAASMSGNVSGTRTVSIDVVSDTICPWCYVGKSRLERAISSYKAKPEGKELQFNVNWHPFQLKPELPTDDPGRNKWEMYRTKFGDEQTEGIVSSMTQTFKEEGLPNYNMDGLTGSTFNSHRLIAWAGKEHGPEAQNKVVDALFQGYFTQAQYINDKEFLKSAAETAGLSKDDAAAVVEDPTAYRDQVAEGLQRAFAARISGVPNFSIGPVQISGAQDPASLERALSAAAAS